MKFGVCTGIIKERIPVAKMCLDAGFDFVEANAGLLFTMSDEEIDEVVAMKLPVYSANGLFPGFYPGTEKPIRVVGPERDLEWCKVFAADVMRKCGKLGIKRVVFGSGKARFIPEGMSKEEGLAQYREVCLILAEEAKKYNVTIVIEPLRYAETNSINTVKEGFEQVKLINHPNVKVLMDIYHVYSNKEDRDYSDELAQNLYHVHWSDLDTRGMQHGITEEQVKFAELLKSMEYDGSVSIEGGLPENEEHAKAALEALREMFK
ncbi:MAG: sugar phosphate isomerase/epimerase [Clostridia bacterium]|nr:sugar phosphate isomerase/epimerase [Clostridia bacterium]